VTQDIRNIAIIAHVDHGKTTLVDAILKQSHIFRDNEAAGELIMDNNELERERGITILAKNTAVVYKDVKINVIDTPGHADFSGEVERVLNMADGCLLIVDAVDGPMPQTRFVLKEAMRQGLRPIVVINKIDRQFARPVEVGNMVQDLFLELATDAEQLDFPILYAAGKQGYAIKDLGDAPQSLAPLLDAILEYVPSAKGDPHAPLQLLVAALTYDNHLGQIAVGRVRSGAIRIGEQVARVRRDGSVSMHKVTRLFTFEGLGKKEVDAAEAGDIVAVAGIDDVAISETLASPENPQALPRIDTGEPTIQMTFGVNTSPFSGQDGKYMSSRQMRERLMRELQTNVSLRVADTDSPDVFLVSGRGELHLAVLIETMRREGFELEVSKPQAIVKDVNGQKHEPYEQLLMDVPEETIGTLSEELAARLGRMVDMRHDGQGRVHLEFIIPTRGLIGFRSFFLKATRGNGVMNTVFVDFRPVQGQIKSTRTGVLVAAEAGMVTSYAVLNIQERAITFVDPGVYVYEGMVVGQHQRENDMVVNICKEKKLTNMRAASAEVMIRLTPAVQMSLEEALDFIEDDEVAEVTPKFVRMRKRVLSNDARARINRAKGKEAAGWL
jgi:GTP-binding protein